MWFFFCLKRPIWRECYLNQTVMTIRSTFNRRRFADHGHLPLCFSICFHLFWYSIVALLATRAWRYLRMNLIVEWVYSGPAAILSTPRFDLSELLSQSTRASILSLHGVWVLLELIAMRCGRFPVGGQTGDVSS